MGLLALYLVLTWGERVPIIHADELGYLSTGHFLGQGGDLPTHKYHPGYSFLLAPLFWLNPEVLFVYRGALILNAALLAAIAPLLWVLLSRLVPSLPTPVHASSVAVAAVYPPLVLYLNTAMAEALLIPGFVLLALLASAAFETPTLARAAGAGLAAGALVLVHPRMLPVVVALIVAGVLAFRPWHKHPLALLGLLGGAGGGLAAQRAIVAQLSGPARASAEDVGTRLAEGHADLGMLTGLASVLGGQLFYLSATTLGLAALGAFVSVTGLYRTLTRRVRTTRDHLLAFLALSFGGVWLLSATFTNAGTRVDHVLYGRYNDAVVLPLLALGLAAAVRPGRFGLAPWRSWASTPIVAGGAILASGALLIAGHPPETLTGRIDPFHIASVHPFIVGGDTLPVFLVAGFGLCAALIVTLLGARWWKWAAGVAACVFLLIGAEVWAGYLVPGHRARADQHVLAGTVERLEQATDTSYGCVGYDWSEVAWWHYHNYRTFLLGREIRRFASSDGEQPCSELFISTGRDTVLDTFPDARRIAFENYGDQALWILPGRTARRLEGAGWLFGEDLRALPEEAYRADVRLEGLPDPLRFRQGEEVRVTAHVTHAGRGSPWGSPKAPALEGRAVNVGVRWYVGSELAGDQRARLPSTMLPGEERAVDLHLRPPPGVGGEEATMVVDMVHEGARWFSEPGDEPVRLRVTVTP